MLRQAIGRSPAHPEGQTNCTVRNEKGKPCHGYLKHWVTAPPEVKSQLAPGKVVLRCERCLTLYESEPHQHLRPV